MNTSTTVKRILSASLLTLPITLPILGVMTMNVPSALAAVGCTQIGIEIPGTGFKTGTFCLYLEGSGLQIKSYTSSVVNTSLLCNSQMKIKWYDRNNKRYQTLSGPYTSGCKPPQPFAGKINFPVKEGRACAEFYESGVLRKEKACLNVFP